MLLLIKFQSLRKFDLEKIFFVDYRKMIVIIRETQIRRPICASTSRSARNILRASVVNMEVLLHLNHITSSSSVTE